MSNNIRIELNEKEALVLFDWLTRFNERENNTYEDQAEERVLWNLEALLEKCLSGPFSDNYQKLLSEARTAIRDSE